MTATAAHVVLGVATLPLPLEMRIVVPGTEDAKRRIGIYARVIATAYSKSLGPNKCEWCEEQIEGPCIFYHGADTVKTYCSTGCLIASL